MTNDYEEPVPLKSGFHDAIHNNAFAWKPHLELNQTNR